MVANDALLMKLFIITLDEVSFKWFKKHPKGSIKTWTDLERLFLLLFYETVSEVTIHTLLAMNPKKNELSRSFVKYF